MPLVLGTDVFWLAGESINQALGSSEAQHREIEVFCLGQSAVCPCWLTICQTRARFSVFLTLTGGSIIEMIPQDSTNKSISPTHCLYTTLYCPTWRTRASITVVIVVVSNITAYCWKPTKNKPSVTVVSKGCFFTNIVILFS